MEAVGRLAGGVAHDFNNLLTAIRGYSELLVDDLDADDPRREDATQIMRAAETATSLTRQLLAFSRKQILSPKIVRLDKITASTESILRRLIGEDIDFSVRSAPDLWSVKADAGQIEQVVMNLAINARDAMPNGGRLTISLGNVIVPAESTGRGPRGECVSMTVTDTGCGIDPETLAHIFEPFFTTKEEGRGTGLGLAMVDGIIEQSGGSIRVESTPGRGTCFRILLPRAEVDATAPVPVLSDVNPPAFETVLLVEDEPGVRQFAKQVLLRQGYDVIEAAKGDEALLHAANYGGPIHLLLTDVVMPGMSGRNVWEELSPGRPEMKVLFVSGYTDDAVMRHGIRESGLPYLQKPFSVAGLCQAVRDALTGGRVTTA
jgi:CheY-like chemotaxis protein